jgi:hypothetical protein
MVKGQETRRREKESRLNVRWMDDVELHLRIFPFLLFRRKFKNCGQNIMGNCQEGSQG